MSAGDACLPRDERRMQDEDARRLAASRRAVGVVFFVAGAGIALWAAYIPLLKVRADLDDARMGLVLLCVALGALGGMPVAGLLRPRLGAIRAGRLAAAAFAASVVTPALATGMASLALAGALLGLCFGFLDICMNAHASAVERELGRPIMSSVHAFFSIGTFAGALAAGGLIGVGLPIGGGLGAAASGLAVLALLASQRLWLPEEHLREAGAPLFQLPTRKVLGVGVLTAMCFVLELGVMDWGALFLIQVMHAAPAHGSHALAAFSLAMAGGRLSGDRLVARLGDMATLRLSALVAALGLAAVVLAPSPVAALPGFFLAGLGIANLVPVFFSLAGRLPGIGPTAGVAMVVTLAYGGGLLGPPLIGFVADGWGLRSAFVLLIGGAFAIALLTRAAMPAGMGR
ncbi:MFS transporter [Ancylobacter sp. 6x-1]|uniref:MFS transporter n=1 Tax=Ancylobacter crimeensis TaxID=2579147 RepID=A0ABT0DC88_9HYPH|nr:MFS transporter [Ancylobacter crimeensis]MCK0197555.1 MFS transporter [Ancylobacter crimeensis]